MTQWAECWFTEFVKGKVKITTHSDDRSILNVHVIPKIGHFKLKKLRGLDLQRFYNSLLETSNGRGGTLSNKTIKNVYIVVNRMLKRAYKNDLIPNNPNEKTTLPKIPRNKNKKGLNLIAQEQLAKLCLQEKSTMDILIVFFMKTGLRLGEALGLQWNKVNFEESYIVIEQQLQAIENKDPNAKHKTKLEIIDSTKTRSSDRELPICEDLVKLLKYLRGKYAENKMKFRPNYEDNNLVFGKDDGGFICDTVLRKHFNGRLEELKIPHARLHDLRHTFATTTRKLVPLEDVSKYLGHSSIVTTADMYIHIDREGLREIANTMNMRYRKEKEDSRKLACEDNEKQPS